MDHAVKDIHIAAHTPGVRFGGTAGELAIVQWHAGTILVFIYQPALAQQGVSGDTAGKSAGREIGFPKKLLPAAIVAASLHARVALHAVWKSTFDQGVPAQNAVVALGP